MLGLRRVERQVGVRVLGRRGCERARDDDLVGRVVRIALREAGRHGEAAGREEGMGLVDAVVDDPDLHPVARGGQVRAPDRGRADERRCLVERLRGAAERVVAHGGVDPGDAGELRKPGNLGARQLDRERVQDDAVVPAHGRGRECALDAALQGPLRRGQAAEVADARGRAQVEPVGARGLRQHAAFGGRLRQWRRVERDHDLGSRRARGGRSGKRKRRQPAEKNKTPFQEGNGTGARLESRADVAELVDAHGSGPCGRKPVEVQVLSSASPDPATFGPATAQTIRT